jgi:hypothetical protein
MAVAAITTHRGRPTSSRAGPNPNQSRRFHSIASPARAWHGCAPASANAECSDAERSAFLPQ